MTDRQWQIAILERDKKCQCCGETSGLCAHHIQSRRVKRTRHDLRNGITLCVKCHQAGHADPRRFEPWCAYMRPDAPFASEEEWLQFKNGHKGQFK